MAQCTATSKRTGERCKAQAVTGRTVCKNHGGKTPVGIAAANFKTGRYSKYLPDNLIEKFKESQSDPELLSLRDDIALIDSRLGFLLERITKLKTEELWEELNDKMDDLEDTTYTGSIQDIQKGIREIKTLLSNGTDARKTWVEIYGVLEGRRRLVESEEKRLVSMQQIITTERAMLLLAGITDTIKRHVTDVRQLDAIANDLRRLVASTTR
ncbi:MAG: hypothetical protein QUS07_07440 [Methanothrix sp.]|nr:hypothetical protein [Methanothrix sp.]